MEKMDGKTMDIVAENVGKLKELFPEAFTEGKVDFEALKEVLGTFVDDRDERYSFTWNGKSKARMIAQTPSTGTLRPCKEESVDWDSTQNIFIEGDNLEVLKLLQKSYHKKVKMIYIDPPYNTGKDFVYKDNFKDNIKNYKEITGQVDGEGRNLSNNPETSGRYHTDWLNMMYPRLKLARNLLKDDGVIFISIDDNEASNIRKLCDEIFGEENFVTQLVWEKKKKGTFLSNTITSVKEYVFVYAKYKYQFSGLIGEINSNQETYPCVNASNKREIRRIPPGIASKYREKNHFLPKGSTISVTTMDLVLHSDLVIKDGVLAEELVIEGNWRYRQDLMEEFALNQELYITQDLYLRRIVNEPREKTLKDLLPRVGENEESTHKSIDINNLFADGWGSNEDGEEELRQLLEAKGLMDFPKPRKLIEKLCVSIRDADAIVLDFFAGSGTTAHALMHLNSLDSGNRKFVLVQLPEFCDDKTEAFKAGYKTIAEISKERIRRSAAKIKEENPDYDGDLGFKVFKLDSTNIKPWEVDFDLTERTLEDFISNIKTDRREEDVLYEILLKYGLDLTLPITEHAIAGQKVFDIGMGALIICLSDAISLEVVEGIAKLKDELNPEIMRVVFKDSGFKDDVVKTNAVQILKQAGILDVRSL
jgi:adenine-specific DNA-methyltransferase